MFSAGKYHKSRSVLFLEYWQVSLPYFKYKLETIDSVLGAAPVSVIL